MRKVLRNSDEVFHYWANKVQAEGRAGNVWFDGDRVYSYGSHFCIAKHLESGAVAFTTRKYSVTTTGHVSSARSAARHLRVVFCHDPAAGAQANMAQARADIRSALVEAEKPRIRQTTRDGHKARALHLAESANAYLAALSESERGSEFPIDTTALEAVRASLDAAEAAAARIREEQALARKRDLEDSLTIWRASAGYVRTGLHNLPCALRLSEDRTQVQTSWGAEIPVEHALRFFPLVMRVRDAGVAWEPPASRSIHLGVYTLRLVRGDGSIVVGCHDIPYAEIERMAYALGLMAEGVAA